MKFRKKPVIIDAFQWNGEFMGRYLPDWFNFAISEGTAWFTKNYEFIVIKTLEGDHRVNKTDYIIKGVKGEIYPCKPDIFEMTYERIEDERKI
jgi:hypothetical protein